MDKGREGEEEEVEGEEGEGDDFVRGLGRCAGSLNTAEAAY